jgi:hypothetical protein
MNHSSIRPSIVDVIEAVRLCAFAPPSSFLDVTVSVFSRRMNRENTLRKLVNNDFAVRTNVTW